MNSSLFFFLLPALKRNTFFIILFHVNSQLQRHPSFHLKSRPFLPLVQSELIHWPHLVLLKYLSVSELEAGSGCDRDGAFRKKERDVSYLIQVMSPSKLRQITALGLFFFVIAQIGYSALSAYLLVDVCLPVCLCSSRFSESSWKERERGWSFNNLENRWIQRKHFSLWHDEAKNGKKKR